jgi:[protein-PII] uridylyltransferase
MEKVSNQREIIERKKLVAQLAALAEEYPRDSIDFRNQVLSLLKEALAAGNDVLKKRFMDTNKGRPSMYAAAFLMDQIIRTIYDVATQYVYPLSNPTPEEKLSLLAVGGYGRGDLAPHSDLDLLFLFPYKQTSWCEQIIEFCLYMLWDLGLKVGHATRTPDECIRFAKKDLTVQTALLEARFLWGDQNLANEMLAKYSKEIVLGAGSNRTFIEAKLTERDDRHTRYGNSRYVVEPNIKEGKGGFRDIQTLFWIAKFVYSTTDVSELVKRGVFTPAERRRFAKASNFLRTVRCHLHYLTNRPEERLTFDVQSEMAERLGYKDHTGTKGVERFMKHYFLVAKDVGDLTRIFCANLEAEQQKKSRLPLPRFGLLRRKMQGFMAEGGRLNINSEDDFKEDPVKLLGLFHLAQKKSMDVHPNALRVIRQNLKLVNRKLRQRPEANKLFLEMLSSRKDPETTLRRLSEAGVLGRFIPDFGRVIAQMQHDMYHVYTVDEHTIRAIGILAQIEDGLLEEEHPLSHKLLPKVLNRNILYVAVLLHDIAKGRGGDHSELGADISDKLCPRLGLSPSETETVSWLVRYHLLLSNVAFKRDISDPKTVEDLTQIVQSPERLKLLLILTVVDIRAVGPNVWNGWKGQLLRELYYAAETALTGGHVSEGRAQRARHHKEKLREAMTASSEWQEEELNDHLDKFYESYWVSNNLETQMAHAELVRSAHNQDEKLTIQAVSDPFKAITEVTVFTGDHPGLFARIAAAMSLSGAIIVDAKIQTTTDGMALDTFFIQDAEGDVYDQGGRMSKLRSNIEATLNGERKAHVELAKRRKAALPSRTNVFTAQPSVLVNNVASNIHTVIEVRGRDRAGLLADVTRALFGLSLTISSAHISTFGERVVDVFYVKDMFGLKITNKVKIRNIDRKIMDVLAPPSKAPAKPSKTKQKKVS